MHFKIDIELKESSEVLRSTLNMRKSILAQELGNYILNNSNFITDEDILSGKIQKSCLFFPDPEHFHRVLNSPGRNELLTQDFK